jgi:replicative DNA helicase
MKPPIQEQELLSLIINDWRLSDEVFSVVQPSDFLYPPHQKIADYCLLLGEKLGQTSLEVAITDNKEEHICGGEGYIKTLGELYVTSGIDTLVEMVQGKARAQRLAGFGKKLFETSGGGNIDEVERDFHEIISTGTKGTYERIGELLPDYLDELERKHRGEQSELKSGFDDLDKVLGGLHRENLIIVGGRPGQGKSSFALNILYHVAVVEKQPAVFFSLEMSKSEIVGKLVSRHSNIPYNNLRDAHLSQSDFAMIANAMTALKEAPLFLDDTPGNSLYEIRSKTRRAVREGAKVAIADYLQLISGQSKGQNRVEFVGTLSRGLKELAKECKIPVIALSQLNRSTEYSKNTEPDLHQLRESGSIEQDADSVVLAYRPDMIDYPEEARIIIAKNRHGETRKFDMCFQGAQGLFRPWKEGEKPIHEDEKPKGR